jgi:hypothetical protein
MATDNPNADSSALIDEMDRNAIIRAVLGRSTGANDPAPSTVDPATMWDAADVFASLRNLFPAMSAWLAGAAASITGLNGPWRGPDADAFATQMDSLCKRVKAQGEHLGQVPDALQNSGNMLSITQAKVTDIDHQVALAARTLHAGVKDGLVQVHELKPLADAADEAMRTQARQLNTQYEDSIRTLVLPDVGVGFGRSNGIAASPARVVAAVSGWSTPLLAPSPASLSSDPPHGTPAEPVTSAGVVFEPASA